MYNPYTLLSPALLQAMLRQPMYFVRQYYPRGFLHPYEKITPLLLTHYFHHETDRERAQRHIRTLHHDAYRYLYDSREPSHLEKLYTAASQPEGYRIYINLLPKKWKPTDKLKIQINRYARYQMSWWNYSPGDKLKVTLKERYGQLFIALLWRGQQTEVLLDDIENFSPCATT